VDSFSQWLKKNHRNLPPADNIQAFISDAGSAGVTERRLRSLIDLPPKLFDPLLHALVSSGQVRAVNRNGDVVYYGSGCKQQTVLCNGAGVPTTILGLRDSRKK